VRHGCGKGADGKGEIKFNGSCSCLKLKWFGRMWRIINFFGSGLDLKVSYGYKHKVLEVTAVYSRQGFLQKENKVEGSLVISQFSKYPHLRRAGS